MPTPRGSRFDEEHKRKIGAALARYHENCRRAMELMKATEGGKRYLTREEIEGRELDDEEAPK